MKTKSKQRVSMGVAMTTNVVPLHAVMITPRHRAGVSTLVFSFFSFYTEFPLTEPLSEQVTSYFSFFHFLQTDISLRITLLRKVKREKLSWTGEAFSEGSFGMPNCKMAETK